MPDNSTMTIFICGSGNNLSDSVSTEYAVPYLAKLCIGHHFALDGIGGNANKEEKFQMDGWGFFDLDEGFKSDNPDAPVQFKESAAAIHGHGVNDIIRKAMAYVDDRYKRTGPGEIKRINLVGFSRGAVCCTQLAWMIHGAATRRQIPLPDINMFLFDPVAGTFNGFKGYTEYRGSSYRTDRTTLPPNVKDFFGLVQSFIAKNQLTAFGLGFNSNMPRPSSSSTNYEVQVMPGGHSASCLYDANATGTPLGQIGLTLAQDFLMEHGVGFMNDVRLSSTGMAEGYAQIRVENDFAKKGGQEANITFFQQGRFLRSVQRRAVVNRNRKISDHPFWVNFHHKKLVFQQDQILAREIDWLAHSKAKKIAKSTWNAVNAKGKLPWTAAALQNMGFAPV